MSAILVNFADGLMTLRPIAFAPCGPILKATVWRLRLSAVQRSDGMALAQPPELLVGALAHPS
jgi:hypothetical protein